MASPLRVALDARMPVDTWGGVQQVVQGLAAGFASLDHECDLLFLGYPDAATWLGPYLGGRTRLLEVEPSFGRTAARRAFDDIRRRAPGAARAAASIANRLGRSALAIPRSNGYLESLGVDLVHFLAPQAVLTDLPSIYQPHDLQHVHLPELFLPLQVRYRDVAYRAFSNQATFVSVMTEWGRDDISRSFGIPTSKIAVVPWAPVAGLRLPGDEGRPMGRVDVPGNLPERFVLYPAQTWRHKNHGRLLDALALLKHRGMRVPLVSTGRLNDHYPAIRAHVDRLGLADQVTFLGFVDDAVLAELYRSATALVFPSLFEGWGLPIVESFAYGVPVAAASVAVIPEVVGDAGLLFDPYRVETIAEAVERLWTDDGLRAELRVRGRGRLAHLSWTKSAATFLALYKQVAGRPLDTREAGLLNPPTLIT
jgi:glycosyltransferase involved in cell wall biosynthesis